MYKNNIEDLNHKHLCAKADLQSAVDEYLKNKDNSLEDRWEVWTKYSQTNSGDWIHHFEGFEEFEEWFHDEQERYLTIDYEEILESYEGYLEDKDESEETDYDFINSELDKMKEYIMEQNLRNYKFDW